jgi:hypothetical protein
MAVADFLARLVLLGAMAMAGCLVLVSLLTPGRRDGRAAARVESVPSEADRTLRVAPVFCTWTANGVVLDCVVVGGEGDGWPLTFTVGLPEPVLPSSTAAKTLQRWADESRPVSVQGESEPVGLVLSDGSTTVRLGVDRGVSVSVRDLRRTARPSRLRGRP